MATKNTIYQEHLTAYRRGSRTARGRILDAVCRITKASRKSAIRRFTVLQHRTPDWEDQRGGSVHYGADVTAALKDLWTLSGEVCAERLQPHLCEYVRVLLAQHDWPHTKTATDKLLRMSLGTVKDRVGDFARARGARRGHGTTLSSPIKELVPIRTAPWKDPDPGFGEVDTVAHCGETLRGDYAYSVQYTDVAVIWTLLAAQWNKGMVATRESLQRMRTRCPFPLRGFDFDSGGEFINYEVVPWCQTQEPPIMVTRTRPYRKNDHGRIEQKNYANLRRWVGYHRYDRPEQVERLNALYAILEDFLNFFVPSVKCVGKERNGSRIMRHYDTAQTAYQRVLAHPMIPDPSKEQLRQKYATLSLRELKAEVEQRQKHLLASLH